MRTTKRSKFLVPTLLGFISLATVVEADASTVKNIASRAERSCLVLEWMDPHELLPAGERWIAKETTRILGDADIGARWDWSRARGDSVSAPPGEHRLRVVLLPSEPSGPGWRLRANTLGATVVDGRVAPPAVYIFYKSVVAMLGLRERPRKLPDTYFLGRASRAFGRVIAHEVAHAIAPGEPHARDGLMQAGLEPAFLTAKGDVKIDAHWRHVLAQGMSRLCTKS